MNSQSLRKVFAWLVSIAIFISLSAFFTFALENLDVETYIDYGREVCDRNDVCRDGATSSEMLSFQVLSFLMALGAYNCISSWRFPPFQTPEGNLTFNVWVVGTLVMSFLGLFVSQIFGDYASWINLALLILIAYSCIQYRDKRISEIYNIKDEDIS